jgi:hypothetical protein
MESSFYFLILIVFRQVMRFILFTLFFTGLTFCAIAQQIDFTGVYSHSFEGETSYLEIIQDGSEISGELHDYRGIYYLHGSVEGERGSGLINLGNSAHFFEMDILGDHLNLYIIDMTEYGEPNYATQYNLMFVPDPEAKKPAKTKLNPFDRENENNEIKYITSGQINAPYMGIQFGLPQGFKADNNQSDVILIANEGFGYIFMFRHDFSEMNKLSTFLKKGYADEEMNLIIQQLELYSDSAFTFKADGYFEGQKVKAEGFSNIGQHGHGVIMFYVMKEDEFLASASEELELIHKSMTFFPVKEHPLTQRWVFDLQGKSLKYGKSSSSDVVSSELLRSTAWINLCPDMTFKMVEPGENGEREVFEGKWNVDVHYGIAHLYLNDGKGKVQSYQLVHENGRLIMNGERWIVLKGFESECN